MIAGFNTDIEYGGTVYHVQTEDKGAPHHMVMSLVYDKGTILASKRTTYDDLETFDEKQVAERVSRQHKLMCAAVMAGRISELVDMTRRASPYAAANGKQPASDAKTSNGSWRPVSVTDPQTLSAAHAGIPVPSVTLHPIAVADDGTPLKPLKLPDLGLADEAAIEVEAELESDAVAPIILKDDVFEDLPIIDDIVTVVEEVEVIPAEAVQVVSELSGRERKVNEKLTLELLGDTSFKGGDRKTINLMLCRGTARKVVPGAQIIVKVLGSAFRPVIFHARSDVNGLAKVHLQLPHFAAGRAALLIRALNEGEEIELRKVVAPG